MNKYLLQGFSIVGPTVTRDPAMAARAGSVLVHELAMHQLIYAAVSRQQH